MDWTLLFLRRRGILAPILYCKRSDCYSFAIFDCILYLFLIHRSVPPKIANGPTGLILVEKPAKTGPPGSLLLPKLVRPDQFWLPKMATGTIL